MPSVFFDTNILLEPAKTRIDLWAQLQRLMQEPYDIVVLAPVKDELHRLAAGTSQKAQQAKLALALLKQQSLKTPSGSTYRRGDAAIVEAARAGDFVATLDKDLKRRLKAKGVRIIGVKQKVRLVLED